MYIYLWDFVFLGYYPKDESVLYSSAIKDIRTMSTLLFYLFGFFINLDTICFFLMGLGAILQLTSFKEKGRRVLLCVLIPFLIINLTPIPRLLLYHLEHRFPQQFELPANAKGLILLGGSFSLLESQINGRPIYNLTAGKTIEFISLARCYPNLPIVFTGTSQEVELTQKLFDEMGIDRARVTMENQSKSTYDNATKSYQLVKPKSEDKWILVTSAHHMPRSVGLFKGAGWNVAGHPVDYHTNSLSLSKLLPTIFDHHNGIAWMVVMINWAGLIKNYLEGYSPELFPHP